jgi:hypothetical protein
MDELELGYTPLPTARPRVTATTPARPSSDSSRRDAEGLGLAAATVAGLALFGAGTLLATPRSSDSVQAAVNVPRLFAERATTETPAPADGAAFETRAPGEIATPEVRAPKETALAENRPESPLPFVGDALGPAPDAENAVASAGPYAPASRERHVLTSFDGTRTLADGPAVAGYASEPAPGDSRPAPVVWNRPVRWIDVH